MHFCIIDNQLQFIDDDNNSIIIHSGFLFIGIVEYSKNAQYQSIHSGSKSICKSVMLISKLPETLVITKDLHSKIDKAALLEFKGIDKYKIICNIKNWIDVNIDPLFNCHWKKLPCESKRIQKINDIDTPNRKLIEGNAIAIDPDGCVDRDDALQCIEEDDAYIVYIHIVDVTSYDFSNCMDEFIRRTESAYPLNKQPIHMNNLYHELSLHSGLNKVFSVKIVIDKQYNIIDHSFEKLLIENVQLTTYDGVDKADPQIILLKTIAYNIFKQNDVDDMHKMVENYMVLANKLVAQKLITYNNKTALLRQHIKSLDCPKELEEICKFINNKKASYYIGECQHSMFGYYTHFTSPLRRVFDMLVHNQLYSALCNTQYEVNNEIIMRINYTHNLYKKYYKHDYLLNNRDKIHNTCTHGFIVQDKIINEQHKITIYIPQYSLYKSTLIFKEFKLFDKIDIKLIIIKKVLLKLHIELINQISNV